MADRPIDAAARVAAETGLPPNAVRAVVRMLAEGGTVPFISRYRKERTGGLDEVQIRAIEEKHAYTVELEARRSIVLSAIESHGKLTPALRAQIESCWVKSALEDIYLPFKPKRRTRAMMARERGLEPLAKLILAQPPPDVHARVPEREALRFVDHTKQIPDANAALAGARDIIAELLGDRADVRAAVRQVFEHEGVVASEPVKGKANEPTRFEMYYGFREKVRVIPSHRFLAICRGEHEGVLRASIEVDKAAVASRVAAVAKLRPASPFAGQLTEAVADAVKRLICPSLEAEVRAAMKQAADREAIAIFAENLRGLLLQPALGRKVVLGIDPGQRTGCKCVVVDDTGKLLHHTVVYLVSGEEALVRARQTLGDLLERFAPFAIAVGNGTHGRETVDFCREVARFGGKAEPLVVSVSESGASVYSASDLARQEFPDLDLTVRGAVSIARRLQDPLAELVKLDAKAIGVGQYQHDVHQGLLERKLDEVVESCVSAVGVELNTASAPLLSHVAGVGASLATRIVEHRDRHGAFRSRTQLLDVAGLGPKAFEQCAGFIRIRGASNPLDASAVHPERYALVALIAADRGMKPEQLVGRADAVASIDWSRYASDEVGALTLEDIAAELVKPGRDPREQFVAAAFRSDVRKLEDLTPGMDLEGIVTNVTAFGAFVDVGVHQDGLVHISQLADRFVRDPHEVTRVGQMIKVRVLDVDPVRRRIALTAKRRN
ncbi:MAG: RNA-binding transcriptional accessory protein [Myxococcota bacterium]|nr:RNA-binding transcriptional accessory protein [Myxococcota bacterium]